ncbi:MAG TPA: AzlD domain-containing protein [Rhodocyclaceae bacterium]
MSSDFWLWFTLLCIAAATHLPRASFIVLGGRVALPPALQRALRYAPAAALAAIIAPDVLLVQGEFALLNPKIVATAVVIACVAISRNPWLPFIAGMLSLIGLRWLLA